MRTQARASYAQQLKKTFGGVVDSLDLTELQKRFLRDRWLDQLCWFESKALANQRRYYALRLITIAGGVAVPALVSLNARQKDVTATITWATFAVSLVVALAAALDGFFGFGERWRSFRRTAELLKATGWQFFELAGPYAGSDHAGAFPAFTVHVEALFQEDLKAFVAQATQAAQVRSPQTTGTAETATSQT